MTMNTLNQFEQGIERILESFNLKFNPEQPLGVYASELTSGYSRVCPLRSENLAIAKMERVNFKFGEKSFLDFNLICSYDSSNNHYELCGIKMTSSGLIIIHNNFLDFEKHEKRKRDGLGVDPSVLVMLKQPSVMIADISNDVIIHSNPKREQAIRQMLLADHLYEDLYVFDRANFNDCGNLFLGQFHRYCNLFAKQLGFKY